MSCTIKDMTECVYGFLPDPIMTMASLTVGALIPQLTDRVNAYMREHDIDRVSGDVVLIMLLDMLDDTDRGMRVVRSTLLFDRPAELTALKRLDGSPCQTTLRRWWQVFDGHARYGLIAVTIAPDFQRRRYELTADDIDAAAAMYDDDEDQRWW